MTTTNKPKTARIASGGASLKAATNGLTPSTIVATRNVPHEMWKGVKKTDIGTGFAPVDLEDFDPILATEAKIRERNERALPQWRNRFIIGTSRFIWFYVNPEPKVQKKAKKKTPINWKNKLDAKTKAKFNKEIAKNLDATANLMMKDLLPISLALLSGLDKAQELVQQAVDDKVTMPRDYIIAKAQMATNLRVIRFMSEVFSLTPEERKLMALEYTRPWSQS